MSNNEPSRGRRIAGNVLMYFAPVVMLGAGTSKLLAVPAVVAEMGSLHLTGWKLAAVGSLELLSSLLFILPRTRSLGLLVVSAYLGGAACAHFAVDQYTAIGPAFFFIGCLWVGSALRYPGLLWSFRAA